MACAMRYWSIGADWLLAGSLELDAEREADGPRLLSLGILVLETGDRLLVLVGQGPLGRISIDLRINSSKLSLLLCTSSTGGKMCKTGPAAIVKVKDGLD
jgi:hypothetical protein